MRVLTIAAAYLITSQVPAAVAAQSAPADPIVQIGVFGYRADGFNVSAAYDTEPSLDSRVYASGTLCQLGAGYRQAPAWAMHSWRFSGRVLSKTPDDVVVQLTWQRTRDSGTELTLPENAIQLTLREGERVALETLPAPAESPCSLSVSFEARYMPRMSAAANGAGPAPAGSQARATDGTAVGGPTVHTGVGGLRASRTRDRGSWMNVDLWLVHTAPGREEQVIHQVVGAPQEGADFAFAPLSIDTPRGPVVVQVSGSFGVADEQLTFITSRSIKSARAGLSDTQGSGRAVTAMPGSHEVLSFELPPITPGGGAPLPNQLAVRVRIAR